MAIAVFDIGLSVEAVSLFLMIESLEGGKIDASQNCTAPRQVVTTKNCLEKWNADEGDFHSAVKELVARNVISDAHSEFKILSSDVWITK
ncbi:hypothetical protein SAMN05660337_0409 [Maridesulfovibrio ferrireducens]|uniref:Uncharacterized protein n=1 Tax=Maridesulfovibrio ferrireducens TaxID=246191 RepID=A0A1G9BTQ0_9BACT|nr:hypothetical protein [Maridesulfovibrio ferrireducens]SDK42564.1 hypothetical protein SAMN05660337_0409 [Maridesulfovibrio ferrireducens]